LILSRRIRAASCGLRRRRRLSESDIDLLVISDSHHGDVFEALNCRSRLGFDGSACTGCQRQSEGKNFVTDPGAAGVDHQRHPRRLGSGGVLAHEPADAEFVGLVRLAWRVSGR
jgi:hypothetical protein